MKPPPDLSDLLRQEREAERSLIGSKTAKTTTQEVRKTSYVYEIIFLWKVFVLMLLKFRMVDEVPVMRKACSYLGSRTHNFDVSFTV